MPDKPDEGRMGAERAAAERAADRPTAQQVQAADRVGVVLESEETRRSRALADAQHEAVRLKMDETVPGGRYEVNGVLVDATGKPVSEKKDT